MVRSPHNIGEEDINEVLILYELIGTRRLVVGLLAAELKYFLNHQRYPCPYPIPHRRCYLALLYVVLQLLDPTLCTTIINMMSIHPHVRFVTMYAVLEVKQQNKVIII